MPLPLDAWVNAMREERHRDAATDAELWALWRESKEPLARALLILAAAHLHAASGNLDGARAKLDRIAPYAEQAPGHPLASWILDAEARLREALAAGRPVQQPPLDALPR